MAEISWIKLKTTMFDDEKIRLIQSMPEANAILVIWIRLLVLAGKTNDNGLIYIQRNMPYSDEMIATLFNQQVNTVRLALQTLSEFDMIDTNADGMIAIANWEKHQNVEGLEQVRLKNAERNKRYRERKKQAMLSDVSVTSRDGTDKELELDKEEDKDIKNIPYSEILNYLNEKTGKKFRNVESNKKLIRARWNEGYQLEDFKTVVDNKVASWKGATFGNGKLGDSYLQPSTLFGTKFDNYLNDVPKSKKESNNEDNTGVNF